MRTGRFVLRNIISIIVVLVIIAACSGTTPSAGYSTPTHAYANTTTNVSLAPLPTTTSQLPTATSQSPTPNPKTPLPIRGVMTLNFLRPGYASGYYSGDVIHDFDEVDPVVGHAVAEEISRQLDLMKQMGINAIAFELRTSDPTYIPGPFKPPECNMGPSLGLQYPMPTSSEIKNLIAFFDLVNSKGMKVYLQLDNTHIEEQPPINNTIWVDTIVNAIRDHPALELITFGGNQHVYGQGSSAFCGLPAEPPLWEGLGSVGANYVEWAIERAHSLGVPYRKLSAEAIVGDYYTMNNAPGYTGVTDNHLWDPILVLKQIFDDLSIPDDQRTYAISFYEHQKCDNTFKGLSCTDNASPHEWALETIQDVFDTIGTNNGARVIAAEIGLMTDIPASSSSGVIYRPVLYDNWNTELALEDQLWILQAYGVEGGFFYHWVNANDVDQWDPGVQEPILQRGLTYKFNPIKDILESFYTGNKAIVLDLTPDSLPPVFQSVSTSTGIVKNGDAITISVNLGETHHFVTADLSDLDTSQTAPLTLIDQEDGTYRGTATLNMWNEASNGTKQIKIWAMDFWNNTATTTASVQLNNAAPVLDQTPPDDNFSGTVIDSSKWTPSLNGGGSITQNGKLALTVGNAQGSSDTVESTWQFSGDFDVQVDFQLGPGWAAPASEHLDGATLGARINGQIYSLTRLRSNNEDKLFPWSDATWINNGKPETATSGKYRLIRSGTQLYLLYDTGSGWQKLDEVDVPTDPATIYLANQSVNVAHGFTSYFDNFHINSGLTTYEPIPTLPSAPVLDLVPPDDDFSGSVLDTTKWTQQINGSGSINQNGNLALTVGSSSANSDVTVISTWAFTGDFDVQVDFKIGEGWAAPASNHLDGATLGAQINGQMFHLTRLRSSSEDKFFPWSSVFDIGNGTATHAISGKYRLVRTGTTLFLLYDIGEGWQELAHIKVPSSLAYIYVANGSVNAGHEFTTYFDNFKINSGLTTYKP